MSASFRISRRPPLHNHSRLSQSILSSLLFSVTLAANDIYSIRYDMCSSLAYTKYFIVCSSIPFRSVFFLFFSFQTNDVVVCSLKYYLLCACVCLSIFKGKRRRTKHIPCFVSLCMYITIWNTPTENTMHSRRCFFICFIRFFRCLSFNCLVKVHDGVRTLSRYYCCW